MNKSPIAAMNELASRLTEESAGVQAQVTSFPSGAAMLDVKRAGRAWVMAYSPRHGFGVDELGSDEGLITQFRFLSPQFEPAAQRLSELTRTNGSSEPPSMSLVVVQAHDVDRLKEFYTRLGLSFSAERHGAGPRHYAAVLDGLVFEIYPCRSDQQPGRMRIGFRVAALDSVVGNLRDQGVTVVNEPNDSPWGRRAVVLDPEGNTVELSMSSPPSAPNA